MAKLRKDINALSADELSDYIHALDVLRARSADDTDDPTGMNFQAALHNDVFVGPCEHGSDKFLPWHRAHLHYFEQLLQAADPPRTENVTIPYWDWIHEQTSGNFPPSFDQPGLVSPGRNDDPAPLPPDTLEIVTTETDQKLFAGYPEDDPNGDYGRLEDGPHNYMHPIFIGGKMANPATAAEDPIYFSFHCFIDLMWAEWQRRNGNPPLTSPDEDMRGFLDQPKHRAGDFKDTLDLDYEYEYSDGLEAAFGIEVPGIEPVELFATEPLERTFADLRSELRENERLQFRFAALPEERKRVLVRLQDLKVPQGGSYVVRAFVHPESEAFDANDQEFLQQHSIGYVVMWRAHVHTPDGGNGHGAHGGHGTRPPAAHHPPSCTVRFDVTPVLAAGVPPASHVLTLQYTPAPNPGDPVPPAQIVEEVELQDVLAEVYR